MQSRITNTKSFNIDLTRSYNQTLDNKPNGLWYAVNDEWRKYIRGNIPHWNCPNNFSLEIDKPNMFFIDSMEDVQLFNDEYLVKQSGIFGYIDWEKVSQRYSGIEITDFSKIRHRDNKGSYTPVFWTYGWDVSSGCIWDLSIVNKVSKI